MTALDFLTLLGIGLAIFLILFAWCACRIASSTFDDIERDYRRDE